MAEKTEKKAGAKGGGQPRAEADAGKSAGKARDKKSAGPVDAAPAAREGTPRLQTFYEQTVRPRLMKEFGLTNPMQLPRLSKVVLNVGMGEAAKNPKHLEAAVEELALITGQKAVV